MMPMYQTIQRRIASVPDEGVHLTDQERSALDRELDELLRGIASESSAEDAEPTLLQLGEFQSLLATICFRYGVQLSERQRNLVRDYDRWDVVEERRAAFDSIRSGMFL